MCLSANMSFISEFVNLSNNNIGIGFRIPDSGFNLNMIQ